MTSAHAVRITGRGGPEVLRVDVIEAPVAGPGQLLIEVSAAGLNRADLLQRRGLYPAPPGVAADIPGLEFAGTVAEAGSGCRAFRAGDRVMGIVGGGAMATHLVIDEEQALAVPADLTLVEAAAIPEAFLTAWDAMFLQGELRRGATALIHAVGSGVGTAAVQLCRASGVVTLGTSRTAAKLESAIPLGLRHALLVEEGRFADRVLTITDSRGVDVVLDLVGGAYLGENIAALAPRGRIVVVGLVGGRKGEIDLGGLLRRRGRLIGTVLRGRSDEEKSGLVRRFAEEVLPLFADGRLAPVIDTVLPMSRITEAHERLEANAAFGKIVLTWADPSAC